MALQTTPDDLIIKSRDQVRDDYCRDYRVRNPAADTTDGSQPFLDASSFADQISPVYADAQTCMRGTSLKFAAGQHLIDILEPEIGLPLPAVGSLGAVIVSASAGGGAVQTGDLLVDDKTTLKFQALETDIFADGRQTLIGSVDTGPQTNIGALTVLRWLSPRAGMGPTCKVVLQSDGSGMNGGRAAETDDDYRARGEDHRANPPASGNDAELQAAVIKTPKISVQQPFTYPAILGPGTTCVIPMMTPAGLGGSRIPSGADAVAVKGQLVAQFPADDGLFVGTLLPQGVAVEIKARWAAGAAGWLDSNPWPAYNATDNVVVDDSIAATATTFRLTTTVSQANNPQPGQTIGFIDLSLNQSGLPQGLFRAKRILTVTTIIANKSWDIVVDTSNGASDGNFIPVLQSLVSPWSDSLSDVAAAVLGYFDTLGPGEQVATFFDPGLRQKRSPPSPSKWPNQITNRLITPVLALPSIDDAVLLAPTVPYSTTVGSPAVSAYLLALSDLAVYQE